MPMPARQDEVYKVAGRHGVKTIVVSNSYMQIPRDPLIERVVVGAGLDYRRRFSSPNAPRRGVIVITADFPLAARCIKAGADVIAPNGRAHTSIRSGLHWRPQPDGRSALRRTDHRRAALLFGQGSLEFPLGAGPCNRPARAGWPEAGDLTGPAIRARLWAARASAQGLEQAGQKLGTWRERVDEDLLAVGMRTKAVRPRPSSVGVWGAVKLPSEPPPVRTPSSLNRFRGNRMGMIEQRFRCL